MANHRHWFFFLVISPFFLLYLSFFVIPILLIPNFLRYNKNWYNKSFTKYNQKWYNKYFRELSGITNWDINENISRVVKYPKVLVWEVKGTVIFVSGTSKTKITPLGWTKKFFVQVLVIPWV